METIVKKLPFSADKESAEFQREHVILVIKEVESRRTKHIPVENLEVFQHGRGWNFQRQSDTGFSPHQGELKLKSTEVSVQLRSNYRE